MREHYRAAKAEEAILTLLMNNNDFFAVVREKLSAESFVTSFYAHVYSQLLRCMDADGVVDISHLSAYFNPEEMSRVTRLFMNRGAYLNTPEECMDCVYTLLLEKKKQQRKNDAPDDDAAFLDSFQQMKENKQ